ncbi:uncharacterized protein MONBRDRAFT_5911 [Monosiga brevicollis MX1]|uniref:Uncharacterized protein n=1 Tax=Monosiga brevicollis TaxID=81824 RepID=A9USU6_MONBE|nr:uncharacterized protein MONBRDRAFT_5911 [Monosiga brevicollis MX1]EDQ91839.1 predicted protein [Monosiga brevicollis MX1]|eukprot:XP_001743125.1 hypothetical protein [Monosiga brevicollis MX1]
MAAVPPLPRPLWPQPFRFLRRLVEEMVDQAVSRAQHRQALARAPVAELRDFGSSCRPTDPPPSLLPPCPLAHASSGYSSVDDVLCCPCPFTLAGVAVGWETLADTSPVLLSVDAPSSTLLALVTTSRPDETAPPPTSLELVAWRFEPSNTRPRLLARVPWSSTTTAHQHHGLSHVSVNAEPGSELVLAITSSLGIWIARLATQTGELARFPSPLTRLIIDGRLNDTQFVRCLLATHGAAFVTTGEDRAAFAPGHQELQPWIQKQPKASRLGPTMAIVGPLLPSGTSWRPVFTHHPQFAAAHRPGHGLVKVYDLAAGRIQDIHAGAAVVGTLPDFAMAAIVSSRLDDQLS